MKWVISENQKKTKVDLLAMLATAVFSIAGFWSLARLVDVWSANVLISAIFYAILVFNTHFAIRCFKPITPKRPVFYFLDTILVLIYILLPSLFANSYAFIIGVALIFNVALIKYSILLEQTDQRKLLGRKINIDALGLLSCILSLAGFWLSRESITVLVVWTGVFLIANIYLFLIKPLYVRDINI